jgi:hypothetical protein
MQSFNPWPGHAYHRMACKRLSFSIAPDERRRPLAQPAPKHHDAPLWISDSAAVYRSGGEHDY